MTTITQTDRRYRLIVIYGLQKCFLAVVPNVDAAVEPACDDQVLVGFTFEVLHFVGCLPVDSDGGDAVSMAGQFEV